MAERARPAGDEDRSAAGTRSRFVLVSDAAEGTRWRFVLVSDESARAERRAARWPVERPRRLMAPAWRAKRRGEKGGWGSEGLLWEGRVGWMAHLISRRVGQVGESNAALVGDTGSERC